MLLPRRSFLAAAAAAPTFAAAPGWARDLARGAFTHGVASGDPLADSVVLWTRFVPSGAGGRLAWEIGEDEAFQRVARRGRAVASRADDFCVKVEARGLEPGRAYFYRFLSASSASPTGRTRTAPRAGVNRLCAALFSCANMAYGYFHAYGHAARRDDIELALHVGDYIYEYARGTYPNAGDAIEGRLIEPAGETVTLNDYCQRYGAYHTDADLLELRRLKPISVVWDDHELANDAWQAGAQNHQPDFEGSFASRIAAASKAYFDWMPIRRPQRRGLRTYRSLDWGDLARIVLLDTRLIGRDRQLDYRNTIQQRLLADESPALLAAEFRPALEAPNRSMLGASQEAWLAETLAASKRAGQTWQIIAQQVQVGALDAPSGLTRLIGPDIAAGGRVWFESGERLARVGLPWNLDTWNGYPAARARLLEACAANAANAIILGGDSHNCWLNNLAAASGRRLAALEFAGGSVSSPGFERTLNHAAPGEREAMLQAANPNLAWCDVSKRGYAALSFTRHACAAEWVAFDTVRHPQPPTPQTSLLNSQASAASGPGAWAM